MRPKPRRPQATVIGDSDATEEFCSAAGRVGEMLASLGITVVTGGKGGVMEAACRGAANAGGLTVGILPTAQSADANAWCSIVIPSGLGHARNAVTVLAGDLVIALGSSAGTLSEVCFAWIHGRPILTLIGCDGWLEKTGTELDHRQTSSIIRCDDIDAMRDAVIRICDSLQRAKRP